MGLVITNGFFYIAESDNGSIEKVEEESKARQFASVSKAVQFIKGGGVETKQDIIMYVIRKQIRFAGNPGEDVSTIHQK